MLLGKYRMLDLSRLYPGPLASHLLADMGMDVVKIEEPRPRYGMGRDMMTPPDPHARGRGRLVGVQQHRPEQAQRCVGTSRRSGPAQGPRGLLPARGAGRRCPRRLPARRGPVARRRLRGGAGPQPKDRLLQHLGVRTVGAVRRLSRPRPADVGGGGERRPPASGDGRAAGPRRRLRRRDRRTPCRGRHPSGSARTGGDRRGGSTSTSQWSAA